LSEAHEFELRVALRIVDHRHSFYHDDVVEQGRSEPLDSNRSVTGSRLLGRNRSIEPNEKQISPNRSSGQLRAPHVAGSDMVGCWSV